MGCLESTEKVLAQMKLFFLFILSIFYEIGAVWVHETGDVIRENGCHIGQR